MFGHSGCVHSEGRSLNTTIVEGPIERHKSRLASRETGDVLTGTHVWEAWTGPNRCPSGHESAVRVQTSWSTGQSRALVKPSPFFTVRKRS